MEVLLPWIYVLLCGGNILQPLQMAVLRWEYRSEVLLPLELVGGSGLKLQPWMVAGLRW